MPCALIGSLWIHGRHIPRRVEGGNGAAAIVNWIDSDLQGQDSVQRVLHDFETIASGRNPFQGEGISKFHSYLGTGNAHSWGMINGLVYVASEYMPEHKVLMTFAQAVELLENYIRYLDFRDAHPTEPPPEFIAEYLCEGDEAERRYTEEGGILGWLPEQSAEVNRNPAKRLNPLD